MTVALLVLLPCVSAQIYVPSLSQGGGTISDRTVIMNLLNKIDTSSDFAEHKRYRVTGQATIKVLDLFMEHVDRFTMGL